MPIRAEVRRPEARTGSRAALTRATLMVLDAVALVGEALLQEGGDARFVLDEEQPHRGTRIQNVAPSPGRLTTPTLPWCASAIVWTIASPSPLPGARVRPREKG